jgi:hypothetical protein
MSLVGRIWDASHLLGVLVTYVVSHRPVRRLADETSRVLPGDELVAKPKLRWQHAITIRARPADVWPWLMQMGCGRAGWYSYDALDNGGVPSADRIVPELQQVQVGDIFPIRPQDEETFVVRLVEPERAIVIGDAAGGMTWAFVLEPVDEHTTRLITRIRATYDGRALGLFFRLFWHPVHFAMQRRQLLNLKRLAEATP